MTLPTPIALNGEPAQQLNDVTNSASNIELDALVLANDDRHKIGARVARLASLNPIERAKQIKATAKELGVPVAAVRGLRLLTAQRARRHLRRHPPVLDPSERERRSI